jgi:hypothetical protein
MTPVQPETDQRTGYRTRTILCCPMLNHANEVIGVLQVLNKRDGAFNREDEELLLALSARRPWPSRTPSCTKTSRSSSRLHQGVGVRHRIADPTSGRRSGWPS